VCDLEGYERVSHLEYLPQPGGDRGAEEPWRMALAWLHAEYGPGFRDLALPFLGGLDPDKTELLIRMIDQRINTPLTCGAGRYFDAVAALLGLCHTATFQAEGPMRLESAIKPGILEAYPFEKGSVIRTGSILRGIADDILAKTDSGIIAAKFHNTLIYVTFETVMKLRADRGLNRVALSGGVFQNKYLFEGTCTKLREAGFEVYTHAAVPCNDGGIALGQLAVAAAKRKSLCV
jgi:hydrogenase maturation protein HypF